MNCVLPVLLVLLSLTFSNQVLDKSIAGSNDTITINDHTEKIPHTIDVQPEPDQQNSTTSSPIITTTSNGTNITTTAVTTTKSTNTTTVPPKTTTVSPNSTSTTASSTTTTLVPTKPSTSTVTPSTKAPVSTSTASPEPGHHRSFDGPSFIGGIVLALGLVAIGFVAFKFYKARIEVNYHTL